MPTPFEIHNALVERMDASGYDVQRSDGTQFLAARAVTDLLGEHLNVKGFGAVGDGGFTDDIATTATSTTVTSARALWVAGDVGKNIRIPGAGATGAVLETTIATFVSGGEITVGTAAGTTVADGFAGWGTDDSAAFAAAVAALGEYPAGNTGYGPTLEIPGDATYYLASTWTVDKPITVNGNGAVLCGSVLLGDSNAFVNSVRDLTAIAAPGDGFQYKRVQGSQFYGLRALGCQGAGHRVGGIAGNSANYGTFYGIYARANRANGIVLDASYAFVNANRFFGPVARNNTGYGILLTHIVPDEWQTSTAYVIGDRVFAAGTTAVYLCTADHTSGSGTEPGVGASWETVWTRDAYDRPNYNQFYGAQVESNTAGAVYGTQARDNEFFGGHIVFRPDEWAEGTAYVVDDIIIGTSEVPYICIQNHTSSFDDEPSIGADYAPYWAADDTVVMEFAEDSRTRLFGGRVFGDEDSLVGVLYRDVSFSSGGMRTSPETRASSLVMRNGVSWTNSNASPEAAVTAPIGSLHARMNGTYVTSLYYKAIEATPGTLDNTGWVAVLPRLNGATGGRPTTGLVAGLIYFDTSLGIPIWYDGAGWVDAAGSTV